MSEKVGYIVTGKLGPMEIGHYNETPRGGVLVKGDVVTLFKSAAAARRAIERTKEYEGANRLRWDTWRLQTVRVVLHAASVA